MRRRATAAPLRGAAAALALGTGGCGFYGFGYSADSCHDCDRDRPHYMSYEALRSAFAVAPARPLGDIGHFVVHGDYLLINEHNQGLHLIDNRDPAAPAAIAFLTIPGNTRATARDGYIFAGSYVDLLSIDARDLDSIGEVSRQTDIFPWDAYQAIDDEGVYFFDEDLDPERGVVIGLE